MVKTTEMKYWKHVTPDMMSEEEPDGDEFVRHSPSWQSWRFKGFLDKLDHRFKSKHTNSLAKPRSYGTPREKATPDGIPSWMIINASGTSTPTRNIEEDSEED